MHVFVNTHILFDFLLHIPRFLSPDLVLITSHEFEGIAAAIKQNNLSRRLNVKFGSHFENQELFNSITVLL